jgi:UDP-N-acetylglucosamine 4,6-dehydratase
MIGWEDASFTYDHGDNYIIYPTIGGFSEEAITKKGGVKVEPDFSYISHTNDDWMTVDTLRKWISSNNDYIGKI